MEGNSATEGVVTHLLNISVTLICWCYFLFAFLFFFSFFYAAALFCWKRRPYAFQFLNHIFFKGFLALLRTLSPRQHWVIAPDISDIKGSIIICNHRSYLDPLILLSLLPRNKTIVKTKFFGAPVFGWLLMLSGYLPSTTGGSHGKRMLYEVEHMAHFFKDGGNLFVFPEGHRNTGDGLGDFHKGVFKIARMYRCPIQVLSLCNTDTLFEPGKFFFQCHRYNEISMEILGVVVPAESVEKRVSAKVLESQAREIFNRSSRCSKAVL